MATDTSHANGQGGKTSHAMPEVSRRIQATDEPIMVKNTALLKGAKDVKSLGQGAVYWGPCSEAVQNALKDAESVECFSYNYDHGMPALREALKRKIEDKNGLHGYEVSVTAGANQALASLMITLVDPGDKVVMFKPYYFNALMAIQMVGGGDTVEFGPSKADTFLPDLDWLEEQMKSSRPPRMVYFVNPNNPTGVLMRKQELDRLAAMTKGTNTWVVFDNTYEEFLFTGDQHHTINAPNIIHVFSFSKGQGLMGWRVGYIAFPDHDGKDELGSQLIKVQDTIPIHASVMSQKIALGSLQLGAEYTKQHIASLEQNRQDLMEALKPLGSLTQGFWGGNAIYMFARLPAGCDDVATVKWLAEKYSVATIPGSACGAPGHLRISYGRPAPGEAFRAAADQLCAGLSELVEKGRSVLEAEVQV